MGKKCQKALRAAGEPMLEAKDDNRELFLGEAADLLFHYLVLLRAKGVGLEEVEESLCKRHR